MKIVDIVGNVNQYDYVDRILRPQGWKYAGSGAYGTVYVKDHAAIKIGGTRGNKGYLRYIESIADMEDNPSKPLISELTYVTCPDGNDYFIVMMERLQPLSNFEDDDEPVGSIIRMLAYGHFGVVTEEEKEREIQETMQKLSRKRKTQRGMLDVLKRIADLVKDGYGLDMHSGNVMVRMDTDELVITDPLV